jgi:hypothetical protein
MQMAMRKCLGRNAARSMFAATVLLLHACATTADSVNDALDPATGVTVTYSNTPMVLYRENPGQAAYARNYVHLGPIEVNKSGTYRYYLWLGIWNTLQVNTISEQQDDFESIVLFADGEPLLLDVIGWTPAAIETSTPVYAKPVATALDAYYRVTADQIRLIADARDLSLRTTGEPPREFALWGEQRLARKDLDVFLHEVLIR